MVDKYLVYRYVLEGMVKKTLRQYPTSKPILEENLNLNWDNSTSKIALVKSVEKYYNTVT